VKSDDKLTTCVNGPGLILHFSLWGGLLVAMFNTKKSILEEENMGI
jgi:hypothetical protein